MDERRPSMVFARDRSGSARGQAAGCTLGIGAKKRGHCAMFAPLRFLRFLALIPGVVLALSGCASLAYLEQAGAGQDELNRTGRDIDALVREKRVPPRTRRLLGEVRSVKQYGEEHGLTATNNYVKYARLNRTAAVWVLSASEPLRFRSKSWSFPVIGSITYLGWFKQDLANAAAAKLRAEGWDVDVRAAGAYSTLGWFDDPVLSTMIAKGDEALGDLVNTVLHESLHATFYVNGQSVLNESIAGFVGDALTIAYLDERVGPLSPEKKAYVDAEAKGEARAEAMREGYRALEALYASPLPDDAKRAEKERRLTLLRARIGFKRPINNATLGQFKTYDSGQAELAALLRACDGSFPRFLAALAPLRTTRLDPQQKDVGKMIAPLLQGRCPAGTER